MNDLHSTDTRAALDRRRFTLALPLLAAGAAYPQTARAANASSGDKPPIVTHHRTKTIDGIKIFYREAGPSGRPGRAAAARLPDLIAHVPQPDPGARRPLPCDRARLSGLRPERHARPRAVSPTPSTASASWWTGCSTSSASSATPCTSWTTARPSAGVSRSSIPSASRALIVQNGNAYEEGLKEFWDPIKAYWSDHSRGASQGALRAGHAGDHQVPVHRRRQRRDPRRSRQLGPRPGAARPARQRRDPDGPVLRLPHQPAALSRRCRPTSASISRRR